MLLTSLVLGDLNEQRSDTRPAAPLLMRDLDILHIPLILDRGLDSARLNHLQQRFDVIPVSRPVPRDTEEGRMLAAHEVQIARHHLHDRAPRAPSLPVLKHALIIAVCDEEAVRG